MRITERQLKEILETIATTAEDEITCAALTEDQLTLYVESLLDGEDVGTLFPKIQHHLDQCLDCKQEVDDIVTMSTIIEANALLEPPPRPVVDPEYSIPLWILAKFREGRRWVEDQGEALWIDFAAVFTATSNDQMASLTRRSEDITAQEIYRLTLGTDELDDLDVDIRAVQSEDPGQCRLTVDARIPSRWPNVAGVEVILLSDNASWRAKTDKSSRVVFEGFPVAKLDQIRIKVTPPAE